MCPDDPYAALLPAWEKFKRTRTAAVRDMKLAAKYQSPMLQTFRRDRAARYARVANSEWQLAVSGVFGDDSTRLEWQSDGSCLVNHILMFS